MLKLKSVSFEQKEFKTHCLTPSHPGQREWSIGRHPVCDLVLSSLEVSRTHGQIVYRDQAYYLMDHGSSSGTILNGEMLEPKIQHTLDLGDLIQLGETFLYVEEIVPLQILPPQLDSGLPSGRSPLADWGDNLTCRCCQIINETPDVKTFLFVAEPAMLFDYRPGQFVRLAVEIDGKSVIRPYSISSSPTRPHHLSITIKRVPSPQSSDHPEEHPEEHPDKTPQVPAGLVSNWMHDHFQVGDRLQLMGGPMGLFSCVPAPTPENPEPAPLPKKLLLISAGSGITPMMSMARWVQDTLADCDIVFFHSARSPEDIVFRQELELMAAQMPNFHLVITVTQRSPGQPWLGLSGRISEAMLNLTVPDWSERSVYVCGSQGFMTAVKSTLVQMNFPMEKYQAESFGGAPVQVVSTSVQLTSQAPESAAVPAQLPSESPQKTVKFTRSGCELTTDGQSTLLALADSAGVAIASACRMGACGACKVRLSQGQVTYPTAPQALTPAEQAEGYELACVAYPSDNVEIEA